MARNQRPRIITSASGARLLPLVAILVLAGTFGSAFLPGGGARAQTQPLSAGCTALNGAGYDAYYSGAFGGTYNFLAGERISLTAGQPDAESPGTLLLDVNFVTAASANYPGKIVYAVPANSNFSVSWTLDRGSATWIVSCGTTGEPAPPTATPTPTNTPLPAATNTPLPTATDVPPSTSTVQAPADPTATATPCVGQGADHTDNASDQGQDRRCRDKDDGAKGPGEPKATREPKSTQEPRATREPKPDMAPKGKDKD